MRPSRSIFLILAFVLVLGAVAPTADARRNCNCDMCQPGNLLAMCFWPGHGTVFCFDYWEFECNLPSLTGEDAAEETLVCAEPEAETDVLPESSFSSDETEDLDAEDPEGGLEDDQSVAPVAVG